MTSQLVIRESDFTNDEFLGHYPIINCNNYLEYCECAVGLRQGEVMSSIMFAMFKNDLKLFLCYDINSGLTLNDAILVYYCLLMI